MTTVNPIFTLSTRDYDAVLFDLDGVLTKTAEVHAAAWKRVFDDFLAQRAAQTGETVVPFDADADYRRYVDGKLREDGVASFLQSRGIQLPLGAPEDVPGTQTVHALSSLKDKCFIEHLEHYGVETYEPAISLVRRVRSLGIKTAVVSSSHHCAAVLDAAGISQLFDARVDGQEITRLGLKGKPAADTFLDAARRVEAGPSRAVVVEDAIAGIQAGRAGGFGLVIGVDHSGRPAPLREAGTDFVVTSLAQVEVAADPPSDWSLVYETFDPAREGIREAPCALGNGYFVMRGAALWAKADGSHYPVTYFAGGYNRLRTDIAGRWLENEDLVNFPNWLALGFRIAGENWFDIRTVKLLSYRQEFDLEHGMLIRAIRFEDSHGRRTMLEERRLVSMSDRHMGAVQLALTAENWSAGITVRSGIDGRVVNSGAQLYRKFNNQHLEPLEAGSVGEDGMYMLVRTCQSHLYVAQAARTQAFGGQLRPATRRIIQEPSYVGQDLLIELRQGEPLVIEKIASLYTSKDQAISECGLAARKAIARAARFQALMAEHILVWKALWGRFDLYLQPTDPAFKLNVLMLRLNLFHLPDCIAQLHRTGYRNSCARLDRRRLPGPHLLGRAVHLPDA